MIVDRYLLRAMAVPFLAGWFLLTAIFAAYIAASLLQDAAASGLAPGALWTLIFLECVIAWEVIIPSSMFFAVLFAFERMNRDRELVALFAGGWSRARILLPVVATGVLMVIIVAMLTLQARPWAYRTGDVVEDRAARPDVAAMQAGRFYALGPSLVVTAEDIDHGDGYLKNVFARQQRQEGDRLIRAQRARLAPPAADGSQLVEFLDGEIITLGGLRGGDRQHLFERLSVRWQSGADDDGGLDRRAQPTGALRHLEGARETAEFQWRLTLPFITFGMTLVAGVIGTAAPGRVTALRMLAAILAYVVVFNVAAAARTALENGTLQAMPGLYWLPLVPVVLSGLIMLWLRRQT